MKDCSRARPDWWRDKLNSSEGIKKRVGPARLLRLSALSDFLLPSRQSTQWIWQYFKKVLHTKTLYDWTDMQCIFRYSHDQSHTEPWNRRSALHRCAGARSGPPAVLFSEHHHQTVSGPLEWSSSQETHKRHVMSYLCQAGAAAYT